METHDLQKLMSARYADGYALLWQVASATGFANATIRYADAMVMNLWPSRGLTLEGFELKVSRSDWLRELKEPAKAESVCRYCDRWWIVAGDAAIVKPDELPPTWGLLVAGANGLRVKRQAPMLTAEPMTRDFLASILRRCSESQPHNEALKSARAEGYSQGEHDAKRMHDSNAYPANDIRYEDRWRRLDESVKAFESASGVRISAWDGGQLGEAVRIVQDLIHGDNGDTLRNIRNSHSRMTKAADLLAQAERLLTEGALLPAPTNISSELEFVPCLTP